ncbi:MAG: zinc metallopeptidase [Lachnospiraceae bacterium]
MGWMYYWDPTYYLVLIGVIITMIASAKVKSTFNKYSRVRSFSGLTGAEAAQRMLYQAGITDVTIRPVSGKLTDHYDPRSKTVNLSDEVYHSASVAAVGVACHECGHAIQHDRAYLPLQLRSMLVPVANFGSTLSWPMILLGILFGGFSARSNIGYLLIQAGILFFSFAVLFQIVTLPVEFNASHRALQMIKTTGMLTEEESKYTRKVLTAAALTYVAGAASAILQLLRLILLFGGRDRD